MIGPAAETTTYTLDVIPGDVEELTVSTVIYLPPEEVYDLLFDLARYPEFSEYIDDVRVRGEGVGTRFALALSWWHLAYTVRGRVTDVDPPNRIEWVITSDVNARGHWAITPADDRAPAGCEAASEARLYVAYEPDSFGGASIGLPRFASLGWVVDRMRPVAEREAEKVARRVVADLEGRRRSVDVHIDTDPGGPGR